MFKELGEFIDETLGINSKKCKEKRREATREEIDAMCGVSILTYEEYKRLLDEINEIDKDDE